MRLLFWNTGRSGGPRVGRICKAVIPHQPDVIILSEFHPLLGRRLMSYLPALGWQRHDHTAPVDGNAGVCVFSRVPMLRSRTVPEDDEAFWLELDFPQHGFGMAAIHLPTASARVKAKRLGYCPKRFWDAVLERATDRVAEPFLLIGDLNTGLDRGDEQGSTLMSTECFARMCEAGWVDVWQHLHGRVEPTWLSNRTDSFRIDYAFVSSALLPHLQECRYSHADREARISDHSIVIVEIDEACLTAPP